MTAPDIDPFDLASSPALSYKNDPVGTVKGGTVVALPEMVQQREYGTTILAFWKEKDGTQGRPKMAAVFKIDTDEGTKSVWAPIPSALFTAIGAAQNVGGVKRRMQLGDDYRQKLTGHEPAANPANQDKNLWAVKITPGAAPAAAQPDPFANAASNVAAGFSPEPPF